MKGRDSSEIFRKLGVHLNAELHEMYDGIRLQVDSSLAVGDAKFVRFFPGFELWTFNILFNETITLSSLNKFSDSLHIIFCLEGSIDHVFEGNDEWQTASRYQNVIVGSKEPIASDFKFPADTKLQVAIFTITSQLAEYGISKERGSLPFLLSDTLDGLRKENTYGYFGKISSKAKSQVINCIQILPSGLHDRLLVESSALGVLEIQFRDHSQDSVIEKKAKFSAYEKSNIIELSEYIAKNLDKDLALGRLERISGLNQKVIQSGFRYYFDDTVNKYINKVRILKGKELLETTDYPISRIVEQIGLSSRSYFSKKFAEKYGILPKDYRKASNIHFPTFEYCYHSIAEKHISKEDLKDILALSINNNRENKVSGCLIYYKDRFFQILEGPKSDVLKTMERIKVDSRHHSIETIFQGIRSGRNFEEWSLALINTKPEFSSTHKRNIRILNLEVLINENRNSSVALRAMWEKARNLLLVNEEILIK